MMRGVLIILYNDVLNKFVQWNTRIKRGMYACVYKHFVKLLISVQVTNKYVVEPIYIKMCVWV